MDGHAAEIQQQFLNLWKTSGTLNLQEENSEVNVQLLAEKSTSFFIKKAYLHLLPLLVPLVLLHLLYLGVNFQVIDS